MEVTLPEEYRIFLKEVGADPHYGLLKPLDNEDQTVTYSQEIPFDVTSPIFSAKHNRLNELDELIDTASEDGVEEQRVWCEKENLLEEIYDTAMKGVTFLNHEGLVIFKFKSVRFPTIISYSGNNPNIR